MSVTAAETKRVEQLEDALRSRVLEMTTVITERLPYFRRIAARYLENAADAEDAVQDALLSAWKHLGEFKGHAQLSTWLTTIVMNSSRTILRKRARLRLLSIEGPEESDNHALFAQPLPDCRPDPEVQFWNSEYERWLHQLFMRLSPALRVVIHMRIVEGLSIRETAEALGLTESAVKARAARAGAKLRRLARKTSRGSLQMPSPAPRATNGFALLNLN